MRFNVIVLAALFTLVPACSKTVEGESKAWTRNTQKIQKMSTLYPSFAAPLKEQLKQATEAMEQAKKVSDKEAAAKAMARANGALTRGFVGKLSSIDRQIKKVQDAATKAATAAADKTDRMAAQQATNTARDAVKEVKARLKQGAKDINAANIILNKVDADLEAAHKRLKTVINAAKKKKKAATKVKKAKVEEAAAAKKVEQKTKAQWKCSYCDKMNPPDAVKCKNCAAPKE